ncbi:MAG: hypothetical protein D6796_08515 [Caldilineae bacterium]|nr:MAG: hypothetical protein D6796_08515 [Caldilineae bacterium]
MSQQQQKEFSQQEKLALRIIAYLTRKIMFYIQVSETYRRLVEKGRDLVIEMLETGVLDWKEIWKEPEEEEEYFEGPWEKYGVDVESNIAIWLDNARNFATAKRRYRPEESFVEGIVRLVGVYQDRYSRMIARLGKEVMYFIDKTTGGFWMLYDGYEVFEEILSGGALDGEDDRSRSFRARALDWVDTWKSIEKDVVERTGKSSEHFEEGTLYQELVPEIIDIVEDYLSTLD